MAASETRSAPQNGQRRASTNATLRQLLAALRAANAGDFDLRLPEGQGGLAGELAKAYNDLADRRSNFADELQRVARVVNREGRLTERVTLPRYRGAWKETVDAVNGMIDDLVRPTTEIARVIDAVADGDLSQKMELKIDGRPMRGEFRRIGTTVNAMVDQLSSLADEVTRVAREVGTEGKLGGQAKVKGASGVWKDLTDNVNLMASNLTAQVRDIAEVTTAVATGDLSKKISVDVKGEILELKDTINTMVDQLSSFADEVTRVAREVGTEGKLGGQARVKGVSGTWKDLTDNVNFMASNLTTQVRGIARVVTAVANGDLDRKFTIEAQGEVAELADTINSMIDTLRAFAGEVTRVAREVGTGGILGGQADVQGRLGRLEGPHRQRQHAREQPHRPGPQHRRGDDGGRDRRSLQEDHRRRQGRDPRAQEHDQHDGRPALAPSRTRSRASRRRSAPRASSAARPRSRACRGRGRTSPTTSTRSPTTSRTRSATSPTSRPRSRRATSRRRSPSRRAARSSS